jgi:hypothetical protein
MRDHNVNTFDFDRAFRTWEHQKGYPLLHVNYNPTTKSFVLTQERFFEFKKVNSEDQSSWYIPINYATASNMRFEDTTITNYFRDDFNQFYIRDADYNGIDWYIFNKQQFGYYRVNYEESNWRSLAYALNSDQYSSIHVMNRVQLLDDSLALAQGGYIDYSIAYDIVKYLNREDDFFPWYTLNRYINSLFTIYGNKNEMLIVSTILELYSRIFLIDKYFIFRNSSTNSPRNTTISTNFQLMVQFQMKMFQNAMDVTMQHILHVIIETNSVSKMLRLLLNNLLTIINSFLMG